MPYPERQQKAIFLDMKRRKGVRAARSFMRDHAEKKAAFKYKRGESLSAAHYDEPTTGNQYRQGVRDAGKINREIRKRRRKQRYTIPKDRPTVV